MCLRAVELLLFCFLSVCGSVCVADNMEAFLTSAERQYIVKYELDGLRAQRDLRVPGLPDSCVLQNRDNICEWPGPVQTLNQFRET